MRGLRLRGRELLAAERGRQRAMFLAILTVLVIPKIILTMHSVPQGGDGGFYTNVARHISNGHGLVTDLSLMHKGFPYTPHPTAVYPAWPMLFGYAARFMGLYAAAVWIPAAFYVASLGLAYLWGASLFPRPVAPRLLSSFNGGHLAMIMLGINREYFWFTSLPYTEGMAYSLLFLALWRSVAAWRSPAWWRGLELGLLAGVIFATRSQLILYPMAILATGMGALLVGKGRRLPIAAMLTTFSASFVAVVTPWYLHVIEFTNSQSPLLLLRFDQARPNNFLSPLRVMVRTDGPVDYLLDRAAGFLEAYSLAGEYAYSGHYYSLAYAAPAALLFLLPEVRRVSGETLARVWTWARDPASLPWIFQGVFAAAGFISIHLMHKALWHEWNFHMRHALSSLFVFVFAMVFLLSRRRWAPVALGLCLLSSSVYGGYLEMPRMIRTAKKRKAKKEYRPSLTKWLRHQREKRGKLTVATKFVQRIWQHAPEIGYHSYFEHTTLRDVRRMVHRLGIDFLIVPLDLDPLFMKDRKKFRRYFSVVGTRSGCKIYAPIR